MARPKGSKNKKKEVILCVNGIVNSEEEILKLSHEVEAIDYEILDKKDQRSEQNATIRSLNHQKKMRLDKIAILREGKRAFEEAQKKEKWDDAALPFVDEYRECSMSDEETLSRLKELKEKYLNQSNKRLDSQLSG